MFLRKRRKNKNFSIKRRNEFPLSNNRSFIFSRNSKLKRKKKRKNDNRFLFGRRLGFRTKNRLRFRRKNRLRFNYRLNYKQRMLRYERIDLGPFGTTLSLGDAILDRNKKKEKRPFKKYEKYVSSKINLNLFKLTYMSLLNYHVPFGKKEKECKSYVQITNVLLYRNQIAVLNILSIFFELRKAINRVFKAVKLRKGVAVLNGRRYSWRRRFTFVFEKWLPGFFTNFWLNINELLSYFFKRRCLTRRQRTRAISLKLLNYDYKFLRKKKYTKATNLISYIKLPTVSLSLIDNIFWHRECLKEGISTIQLTDISSDIEKIEYPIVANQKSIPFLSFISLLFKEVGYQGRFWEIKNFKKKGYYSLNAKKKIDSRKDELKALAAKWLFRYKCYYKKANFRVKRGMVRKNFRYKHRLNLRKKAYLGLVKKKVSEKKVNIESKHEIFRRFKNVKKYRITKL